jgi:hypothetical protein
VDRARLLGPEARDPKPLQQARRHLLPEPLEVGQAAVARQRRDLVRQRRSDAPDPGQLAPREQLVEITIQAPDDPRGVVEGSRLDRVLTQQLQQESDLHQCFGHVAASHQRSTA